MSFDYNFYDTPERKSDTPPYQQLAADVPGRLGLDTGSLLGMSDDALVKELELAIRRRSNQHHEDGDTPNRAEFDAVQRLGAWVDQIVATGSFAALREQLALHPELAHQDAAKVAARVTTRLAGVVADDQEIARLAAFEPHRLVQNASGILVGYPVSRGFADDEPHVGQELRRAAQHPERVLVRVENGHITHFVTDASPTQRGILKDKPSDDTQAALHELRNHSASIREGKDTGHVFVWDGGLVADDRLDAPVEHMPEAELLAPGFYEFTPAVSIKNPQNQRPGYRVFEFLDDYRQDARLALMGLWRFVFTTVNTPRASSSDPLPELTNAAKIAFTTHDHNFTDTAMTRVIPPSQWRSMMNHLLVAPGAQHPHADYGAELQRTIHMPAEHIVRGNQHAAMMTPAGGVETFMVANGLLFSQDYVNESLEKE